MASVEDKDDISSSSDSDVERTLRQRDKLLVRRLDRRIVPGVALLYLLSFLDRANVANARLFSLDSDLGLNDAQYLNGLTLFFVGYVLFEVVWNIILKRTGPKFWLPTVGVAFGVVALCQGFVQNKPGVSGVSGFLAVRFFLGVAYVPPSALFANKRLRLLTLFRVAKAVSSLVLSTICLCGTSVANDSSGSLFSSAWLLLLEHLAAFLPMALDSCKVEEDTADGGEFLASLAVCCV